jgi:hypothetical protein
MYHRERSRMISTLKNTMPPMMTYQKLIGVSAIRELAQEEGYSWACFAPPLAANLNHLCWSIV